jgi:prepilin peptidase CpaA
MIPFLVAAVVVALAAAIFDATTGHMPNWLTLGALALGPPAHFAVWLAQGHALGESFEWLLWAAAGAAVCAGPALVLWRGHAIGGGDVKLLAALGGLCGPRRALDIVVCSFVGFVALAAVVLARRGELASTLRSAGRIARALFSRDRDAPAAEKTTELRMGPAIFAGLLAALAWEAYVWPLR